MRHAAGVCRLVPNESLFATSLTIGGEEVEDANVYDEDGFTGYHPE